jgi:hypothetical protein
MNKLHNNYFFLLLGLLFFLSSCCEPAQKNSFPQVISSSYSDTAIKDADQVSIQGLPAPDPLDSAYYPIYSIDIKNTGTEADTFKITYTRVNGLFGIPLTAQVYVQPDSTRTLKTYGPISSNSLDSAKYQYLDFFVKTADSIHVSLLKPQITIHYGATPNGAEQCGTAGKDLTVDPSTLHK